MQLRITSRKKLTSLLCALGLISIVAIYPRQTVNFFYSTAIQIKDYIHFYGYRPVKSFAIRIPASYTIHGIDVSRWQERIDWQRVAKMRDNGIRLQFAFKPTRLCRFCGMPFLRYGDRMSALQRVPVTSQKRYGRRKAGGPLFFA